MESSDLRLWPMFYYLFWWWRDTLWDTLIRWGHPGTWDTMMGEDTRAQLSQFQAPNDPTPAALHSCEHSENQEIRIFPQITLENQHWILLVNTHQLLITHLLHIIVSIRDRLVIPQILKFQKCGPFMLNQYGLAVAWSFWNFNPSLECKIFWLTNKIMQQYYCTEICTPQVVIISTSYCQSVINCWQGWK